MWCGGYLWKKTNQIQKAKNNNNNTPLSLSVSQKVQEYRTYNTQHALLKCIRLAEIRPIIMLLLLIIINHQSSFRGRGRGRGSITSSLMMTPCNYPSNLHENNQDQLNLSASASASAQPHEPRIRTSTHTQGGTLFSSQAKGSESQTFQDGPRRRAKRNPGLVRMISGRRRQCEGDVAWLANHATLYCSCCWLLMLACCCCCCR